MRTDDVIRDLTIYFQSIGHAPQLKIRSGGWTNPSFLTVDYRGKQHIIEFWDVAGGSEAEKALAKSFMADIKEWLNALQVPSPSGLLQHPQGGAGEARRERERMECGEQGHEAASPRRRPKAEVKEGPA